MTSSAPAPDLVPAVAAFVARHHLLPPGPVVIAFSGGPDSLCLLHVLADLAPARGWRLVAAHLDHGLRPESAAEVGAVRALAAARGVPLRADRVDVAALAAERGWSIEAAGRVARYRFLAAVAAAEGGAPVATGHTEDDQAETLLLRLARGAGLTGLAAMRPATRLPPAAWDGPPDAAPLRLVRPLLATGRAAVEADLARRGLKPLRDPTNADPAYARNRLRHGPLAAWRALDPGIAARLARAADLLAADEEYLAEATERAWALLGVRRGPGPLLALDRAAFLAQPLALRRRLLRRALAELGAGTPTAAAIEAALAVAGQALGEVALPNGVIVSARDGMLRVRPRRDEPAPPSGPWMLSGTSVPLERDGTTVLPGGAWAITCRTVASQACDRPLGGRHAHFRLDLAAAQPAVRTWRPGDRIALPGLGGRKKLSDLFIDRKVARAERATVPLLVAGDAIAWVAGLAVGEPWRAAGGEPRVVCCTIGPAADGLDSEQEDGRCTT